ncbi:hypothetical protein [Bartonella sp. F02]|uniref:hypothetical protein n=1 Tax=Bartonella sp. F02 TaxID=2967262 RepID=UPI0022A98C18|nr:hypothetical protein [Bartonella sp. F02]MCZ2328088.1 hypothetical protein [Bartonella sp. F02]
MCTKTFFVISMFTFLSVSAAQGAGVVVIKEMEEGVITENSPLSFAIDALFNRKGEDDVCLGKLFCIDQNADRESHEIQPVSWFMNFYNPIDLFSSSSWSWLWSWWWKDAKPTVWGRGQEGRPRLFRGPLSF